MACIRTHSAQTMAVLRALAGDPTTWRYGYDLCLETAMEVGIGLPDSHQAGRPRSGRVVMGAGRTRKAPSAPVPPDQLRCGSSQGQSTTHTDEHRPRHARLGMMPTSARSDAPATLLRTGALILGAGRPEWGRAMLAELEQIADPGRRWAFALGCLRCLAFTPPLPGSHRVITWELALQPSAACASWQQRSCATRARCRAPEPGSQWRSSLRCCLPTSSWPSALALA